MLGYPLLLLDNAVATLILTWNSVLYVFVPSTGYLFKLLQENKVTHSLCPGAQNNWSSKHGRLCLFKTEQMDESIDYD